MEAAPSGGGGTRFESMIMAELADFTPRYITATKVSECRELTTIAAKANTAKT